MILSEGALSASAISEESILSAGFSISPSAVHVVGRVTIVASGIGTTWSAGGASGAGNPFTIVSGPAIDLSNYDFVSETEARFSLTVTALSQTPIVISDGLFLANLSSAPVVPGAPTGIVAADQRNGLFSVSGVLPVDNGGSAITLVHARWSGGTSAVGPAFPLSVAALPDGVAGTMTISAENIVGEGPASAPSGSITPNNLNVVRFTAVATFPTGTTIGAGLAYKIRNIVAGALQDVTGWITTGLTITPGMTASSTQPAGYTVNSTVTPNNVSGGFNGEIIFRSHSAGPVYVGSELNVQGRLADTNLKMSKRIQLLSTDSFSTIGRRLYQSVAGNLIAREAHTTTGIVALPEFASAYLTDVSVIASANGGFDGFVLWDLDQVIYLQDTVFIPSPASLAVQVLGSATHMDMVVNL